MAVKISSSTIRIIIMGAVLLAGYVLLLASLWKVQISKGEVHRQMISRQSIRRIRIPSIRGRIITSDGHIIADNKPSFSIILHLAEMRQPGRRSRTIDYILKEIERIATQMGRKSGFKDRDIISHVNYQPGLPLKIFSDLNSTELALVSEIPEPVPGMEITVNSERFYPDNKTFCHILGYTGPEDPSRAEDKEEFFYYVPDLVGRQGLESALDTMKNTPVPLRGLKGVPGGKVVRVDHRGYIFETVSEEEVSNGNDMVLTVDWQAQTILTKLLQKSLENGPSSAASVVLDADTGAVIAMVSLPSYDPNMLSGRVSSKQWRALLRDKTYPMMNRATGGQYTPGSIVKPLVAMALLENNIDTSPVVCDGATHIANARIRCASWRRGGHGEVSLVDALAVSCNDYFIEKGLLLGMERMTAFFRSAGLGKKTGFILHESPGLIPDRLTKQKIFKNQVRWNEYDTGLLSIGQGIIMLTPLQAVRYTAAIANGGKLWHPYLLKEIKDSKGNVLYVSQPKLDGILPVTHEHLEEVRKGMHEVVVSPVGSGKKAHNNLIDLYGKSGTGEVGSRKNRYNNTWFISFGTYKGKTYAMIVFVERGSSGGGTCAPVVKEFFQEWLKTKDAETEPAEG